MTQPKGVLILEDTALLLEQLAERCAEEHFKVFDCCSIYEAIDAWNNHQGEIRAIVTDINMDSNGLTETEARATKDGKFSGWLWVNNYVIPTGFFAKNVIILSEYNRDLGLYTQSSGLQLQKDNYRIIQRSKHFIDKVDPSGATQKLMEALRKLMA